VAGASRFQPGVSIVVKLDLAPAHPPHDAPAVRVSEAAQFVIA
jgi:hypothetical protein